MHGPPEIVHLPSTQSPEPLGPGEGTKCLAQPGLCPCRAPENLNGLDLGNAQNARPTWDSSPSENAGA